MHQFRHLILLGPPGAGKGTQSRFIVTSYGYRQLSTGDMLRSEVANKTALGRKIDQVMQQGLLVSDDIIIALIRQRIANNSKKNFIFDGFPRTLRQAKSLDQLLLDLQQQLFKVIELRVKESDILMRIAGRISCAVCGTNYHVQLNPPRQAEICDNCNSRQLIARNDDDLAVIEQRLKIYQQETEPLRNYYQQSGLLVSIDGNLQITEIKQEIQSILQLIPN